MPTGANSDRAMRNTWSGFEPLGATPRDGGTDFVVWAPLVERLEVSLHRSGGVERAVLLPPPSIEDGRHRVFVPGVGAGDRYSIRFADGRDRPDPASRLQPDGVHGPSEVVDLRAFAWTDGAWRGLMICDYVLYELHVGTFTREGTFDAVIPHLPRLREMGVTAIEIMPVAANPGARNWGYDGVLPYAVQADYGGPRGLQRLVDAAHAADLAVVLDVVYNHFGPEGNYHAEFAPMFNTAAHTPWGAAINLDGPHSDGVRRFLIDNARQWFEAFHIDGLRLDAVQTFIDRSAYTFMEQLADETREWSRALSRPLTLIAESDLNDPRIVRAPGDGGIGFDAMWVEDLHHAVHAHLTGERAHYYVDFGSLEDIAKAWRQGFVHDGVYSRYYGRHHGRPVNVNVRGGKGMPPLRSTGKPIDTPEHTLSVRASNANADLTMQGRDALAPVLPPHAIVAYAQNHDQVGNRPDSERLGTLLDFESQKLAAALILLAPFTPLIFMGDEQAETRPFHFFTDHGDAGLGRAVWDGRRRDLALFGIAHPAGHTHGTAIAPLPKSGVPDPQARETFDACVLTHGTTPRGEAMSAWYRAALAMRRRTRDLDRNVVVRDEAMIVEHGATGVDVVTLFHSGTSPQTLTGALPDGAWQATLDSTDHRFAGRGGVAVSGRDVALPPRCVVVFERA